MSADDVFPGSQEFETVEINSWNHFQRHYDEHFANEWGRWAFRGQSNANWRLETRIDRELTGLPRGSSGPVTRPMGIGGLPVSGLRSRIELFFIKAFRARAPLLLNQVVPSDTLTLLSLMQHWGYPTRLLDFSTSPFVALHFALAPIFRDTNHSEAAAIFAIDHIALGALSSTWVLSENGELGDKYFDHSLEIDFSTATKFDEVFFGLRRAVLVAPVHPPAVHERMVAQQGTFLCQGNIIRSFEWNLKALVEGRNFPLASAVRKLVFTPSAALQIFPRLAKMNIHEASLFPDLAGHARSVIDTLHILKAIDNGKWLSALEGMEKLDWLC